MVLSNFLSSALTEIACSQSSKLRSEKENPGLRIYLSRSPDRKSSAKFKEKQFLCVEKMPHSRSRSAWQLLGEAHLGLLGSLGEHNKSQVNPAALL